VRTAGDAAFIFHAAMWKTWPPGGKCAGVWKMWKTAGILLSPSTRFSTAWNWIRCRHEAYFHIFHGIIILLLSHDHVIERKRRTSGG
jgi:hypothetical protein